MTDTLEQQLRDLKTDLANYLMLANYKRDKIKEVKAKIKAMERSL